uniref:Uncharacterized protein n=1 Tax=Oryza meridionalis TaxID=40149 RepID=A0A0E0DC85_9ORYZ
MPTIRERRRYCWSAIGTTCGLHNLIQCCLDANDEGEEALLLVGTTCSSDNMEVSLREEEEGEGDKFEEELFGGELKWRKREVETQYEICSARSSAILRRRRRRRRVLDCCLPRKVKFQLPRLGSIRKQEEAAMLRHLKSAAARSPVRSPPPPPPPSAPATRAEGFEEDEEEEEEESARAIAVNMFIANTVEFLNSFAAQCNDKLSLLHRKIVKLDSSLNLLEAKLRSIDDTNAFGHSTNQKAHGLFTQDGRFEPTNLLGLVMLDYATLAGRQCEE